MKGVFFVNGEVDVVDGVFECKLCLCDVVIVFMWVVGW